MRSKKAQVTLFVIIGLVLLIGAGLFLLLTRDTVVDENEMIDEFTKDITQVDSNYQSIQSYIQGCMQLVGTRGLKFLGEGGGYLRPLDPDAMYPRTYDEADFFASEGVLLSKNNEDTFVPYWYHSTSSSEVPNIDIEIAIPEIEIIQAQLEDYINKELLNCIDNFTALEFAGAQINMEQEPQTEILFTNENVLVKTEMRTMVNIDGNLATTIDNYFTPIEIPFMKYYTKAQLIAVQEMKYNFLENLIIDLISYYGKIDYDALPPIAMSNFKEYAVMWNQEQVNQRLKSLLQSYVPLFRIANTKNGYAFEIEGSEIEEAFYNSFLLSLLETYNPNLEINFIYLNWPVYSKVFPTDGVTIAPGVSPMDFDLYGPEQINNYQFFYDVSYPVVVELREENLSNGEDYTFMFAMEANLKRNRNWKDHMLGRAPMDWDFSEYSLQLEGAVEEVVDPITQKTYDVSTTTPAKVLFGDDQQHVSGNITLYTHDITTGASLEQVSVSVGVGIYAKTFLGHTELNERGVAKFVGTAPAFVNGYLMLKKTGYATHHEPLTLEPGVEKGLGNVGLLREQVQEVHIRVLEYFGTGEFTSGDLPPSTIGGSVGSSSGDNDGYFAYREMNDDESVFVTFTKLRTSTEPTSYTSLAAFEPGVHTTNLTLIPGTYTIQASLIDEAGVIIPEKSKRICDGFIDCLAIDDDEEWIPKEPVEIKPAMWGGVAFGENQPWYLAADKLYEDNIMELTVLKFPPPKSFDSMQDVGDLETYTIKYKSLLLPELIS